MAVSRATKNAPPEDPVDKEVAKKAKADMPDTKLRDPSKDDPNSESDMPVKEDDTNAESSMHNYIDGGGSGGVSKADEASEGKVIPDKTLSKTNEKTVKAKLKEPDPDGDDAKQRDQGASEEQLAAKRAYDDAEKDYAAHPQISRTYDGEEDVAAIQKRRNAERAYKQAGIEIPEHTGYVFLDSRPKQENIGAGEETSQGEYATKEVTKKEDANVENR